MNKQKVVYTCNGVLFSIKKEGILTHATTWMNSEDIMLSETSQSQKDNTVGFYLHEVFRVVKSTERERMVVARSWGRGNGELVYNEYRT